MERLKQDLDICLVKNFVGLKRNKRERMSKRGTRLFVCFDLGFQISNPLIEYRSDPSCMSMEAHAEMP